MVLGFGWGGWTLGSKAQKMANDQTGRAVVAALAPICVANFQRGADATAQLAALKATDSWKQDAFVKDGGWATFPGSEANRSVAESCANLLTNPPVKSAAK